MNAFTSLEYQIETVKTKFRTANSATQLRNLLKKRLKSDLSSTFSCTFRDYTLFSLLIFYFYIPNGSSIMGWVWRGLDIGVKTTISRDGDS